MSLRMRALKRLWSIIDLLIVIFNLIVMIDLIANFGQKVMRCIEALLVLFLFFKSLYFLSLVSEIAPLVNIIFVILREIQNFLIIFILGIGTFVFTFWIIGKN